MNVSIYARFSSAEQAGTSTIQSQVRACKEHALSQGWKVSEDHIYFDEGIPGAQEQRPAFQQMIAEAKRKENQPFQKILVWKYSRFFRDREKSAVYKGLLRRHGVEVISVTEPVDKSSAVGLLMEGMIEVIDQFYSARLSEETKRGQKENLLAGFRCGSVAPYGYRRVEIPDPFGRRDSKGKPRHKTRIKPDKEKIAIVRRIFKEFAENSGIKKIAIGLNKDFIPGPTGGTWDPSTIRGILLNEVYLGWGVRRKTRKVMRANGRKSYIKLPRSEWLINEKAHPAIISKNVWEKAQERFKASRPKQIKAPRAKYLLAGFLKCGECGGGYTTKSFWSGGKEYLYYVCGFRWRRGSSVCSNRIKIPHDPFNQKVLQAVMDQVLIPERVQEIVKELNQKFEVLHDSVAPEIRHLKRELSLVNRPDTEICKSRGRGRFLMLKE